MGTPANVKMGVCNVTYDSVDLGYTSGGVSCAYTADTTEIEVDQEAFPIKEVVTKQSFEVTVPMAEHDLTKLSKVFPDCTLTPAGDGTTATLALDGGVTNITPSVDKALVLTPVDGDNEEVITIGNASVAPSFDFAFEKDNARVYEVTFKANACNTTATPWVKFGTGAANT